MKFNIGESVKVKEGIMCPDDDSVDIGGWQGRVFEVDECVGIRWDSVTLKQLPPEYIKQCEEEGLDWAEMYLSADEIESTSPRDSEETADQVREEMESASLWLGGDEEDKRIFKVIANAEDEVEAWNDHLLKVLNFPFEAEVSEPQERGHLDCGDKVKVHRIVEADDLYGLLVDVSRGREQFVFPLCDLEVRDRKSPSYTPVKDYCVWFANR